MNSIIKLSFLLLGALMVSVSAMAQYDDVYYNPDLDASYSYDEDVASYDDESSYGDSDASTYAYDDQYFDGYDYSRRINRFYRPSTQRRFANYYSPWYLGYSYDPFFGARSTFGYVQPGVYVTIGNRGARSVYNPYAGYGWNRGWNRGVNTGWSRGGFGATQIGGGAYGCPPSYYGNRNRVRTNTTTTGRTVTRTPRQGTTTRRVTTSPRPTKTVERRATSTRSTRSTNVTRGKSTKRSRTSTRSAKPSTRKSYRSSRSSRSSMRSSGSSSSSSRSTSRSTGSRRN